MVAAKLAPFLPPALRFRLCGLPGGLAEPSTWKKQASANGESSLAVIENGIACNFGAHLTGDGLIIPELSPGTPAVAFNRFLFDLRMRPEIAHRPGSMVSLALDGHKNFYHWMYEVLPRWHAIKGSNLTTSGAIYAYLQHRFHRESLALLGLVPARVIDSATQPFIRADMLYVPPFVRADEPWVTQWLRDSLLAPALKHSSLHTRKRLYVSRKLAQSRRIVNEPELVALLKQHEFTEVCLEDFALSGQIALFHAAQAIVAPHGAGLTNLTFSEPNTFALELIAEGAPASDYERIARARGLRYETVRATPQNPSDLETSDLVVPLDAVKAALAKL